MKTIIILMDSLNRDYLKTYGGWVETPNIDRLAARGRVFENHYAGSLPCMPARREIMTGRYNFLETPWGPIEPWDVCGPTLLRDRSVYTHMITDHYHYFHRGGSGYHYLFDSWEFLRGQEADVWHPLALKQTPPPGARPSRASGCHAYWANSRFRDTERDEDYPTPQCFMRAIKFVENNHAFDDWHLHLEVFDPHEPFDAPRKYRDLYNDDYDGPFFNWPDYRKLDPEQDGANVVNHIRCRYAAVLSMADHWLGRLLDKLEQHGILDDTCVILTTDHGHMLGEHGYWAKNYQFDYRQLVNIPLIAGGPGIVAGSRAKALTGSIDLMPTLLDLHGMAAPKTVHGKSLKSLFADDARHHDSVLYGYFGKDVNWTDGRHTYCRQPLPGSSLYLHTATPSEFAQFNSREGLRRAEMGNFLASADVPLYRFSVPSQRHADAPTFNPIYDLKTDLRQECPIRDQHIETRLAAELRSKLIACQAPACQFERLGY